MYKKKLITQKHSRPPPTLQIQHYAVRTRESMCVKRLADKKGKKVTVRARRTNRLASSPSSFNS